MLASAGGASDSVNSHTIWGSIEAVGDSHSTLVSKSDGDAEGLPAAVQATLADVEFQEYSASSSQDRGCAGQQPEPARSAGNLAAKVRADTEARPTQLGGAGGVAWPAGSGARLGALEDVAQSLGEKEQKALVQELLQNSKFWSLGSAAHSKGRCRPCHYIHTKAGCQNSRECLFCHVPHTRRGGLKAGKSKRLHCQEFVSSLEELGITSKEQITEAICVASSRSAYLRGILLRRLEHQAEEVAATQAAAPVSPTPMAAELDAEPTEVVRKKKIMSL